ncbi:hypothetical protein ACM42_08345 [Bradyrhizobium sp. CCBAU 25338]|uniref:hypothetical protein n=1 Tax=Bradyrhizobium sp. CCBAU 45389 TaxID=858429 RepID=UPI0023059FF7|nr:hypothetical protein [Bradyrhizobium sp. CCBAU 45389]MDA9399939.1 hypothetical protein [Bradyrhizobium sp. CCBAU 45389]MDA9528442.1 hypothetical protein [Bradyrhizobium sp. CCBAU 25338]
MVRYRAAGGTRHAARGMICSQSLEPLCKLGLVQPFDRVVLTCFQSYQAIGRNELDGTCAVISNI